MNKRELITLLGSAAAAWPLAARAQQSALPVIGSLYGVSAAEWAEPMGGFRRGLNEQGFVEGRNVTIEYRWAEGQFDRMPAMVADLVSRKVAVILVGGNLDGVRAAIAATRTIPIVFTTASDPVATGLVASLNRPGGNATGVTVIAGELGPKRLELLHELLPTAKKIALLVKRSLGFCKTIPRMPRRQLAGLGWRCLSSKAATRRRSKEPSRLLSNSGPPLSKSATTLSSTAGAHKLPHWVCAMRSPQWH
jgi:ABC-type uncharacterized transport system substrate-binding protein